jgi:hypothetical protein
VEEKRMEWESRELSQQYRKSEDTDEKRRIRERLKELLSRQFDKRESFRMEEIKRLEKRIMELKQSNQERLQNKEKIVEQRMETLLGEDNKYKW